MSTVETPPEAAAEDASEPDLAALPSGAPSGSVTPEPAGAPAWPVNARSPSDAVLPAPARAPVSSVRARPPSHAVTPEPVPGAPAPESTPAPAADVDRLFTAAFVRVLGTQAAYGFAMSVYLLLPKSLAQAGGTPSQIGRVMAAFGAASVLTIPFLGRIIGGLGRRRALIVASLVMAVTSLGFAITHGPGLAAVVLRAVQGLTWALMFSAGISLASELAPPARLAQAIGFAGGASLAMSAVAPAVGEPLVAAYGYRPLYVLAAVAALIGAALASGLPRRSVAGLGGTTASSRTAVSATGTPSTTPASPAGAVAPTRTAAPAGSPVVATARESSRRLPVYVALGIGGFAYMVLFTFLGPFALEHGVTAIRAFFVSYTVAALAVRILAGRLFDRLGHRAVGVKALAMYGLVVASAGIIGPGWLTTLGLAFGLAHGAVIPSLMALLLNAAPLEHRPRTLGIANAAMSLGIAAVYPAGGLVGRLGYPAVFIATGVLTACSAWLIREVKGDGRGAA